MTPIDWPRWQLHKSTVEEALRDGYAPPNVHGGRGAVIAEATRRLVPHGVAISRDTLRRWAQVQDARAAKGKVNAAVDWGLYKAPPGTFSVSAGRQPARTEIWTSAQDDTPVHEGFLRNLRAYAAVVGARLRVGPFTYNKAIFTDHETRNGVFSEAIRDDLQWDRHEFGPHAVFCAEMNTLPTAARPLSALEAYTRGKRIGAFPHAKLALESIPAPQDHPTPMLMTTGAVTVENYVAKKAGLKAAFHHVIGALIVELDADDVPWARQLNADSRGDFQDLDVLVRDGAIATGQRVEAITWGDIHRRKLDRNVALGSWGFDPHAGVHGANVATGSMLDALKPRYQFVHDLFDGESINHHESANPHARFDLHRRGRHLVADEVAQATHFLTCTERDWCQTVVVESNHDRWLEGWLAKADYRSDPANAMFFLRSQLAKYEALDRGDGDFSIFRHVVQQADPMGLPAVTFSPENGSFRICPAAGGGIECGWHGHLGPNGAKASDLGFTKVSVKLNKGHSHQARIMDGVYSAGVSGELDMKYNKGASSWSHSHIVTYSSGKRAIVTMTDGKWRA